MIREKTMERNCDFCGKSRSSVYCKADAAFLCLCCDARVHSANALSQRHLRALLCESCGCEPAFIRCFDHCLFMCCDCDRNLHGLDSQHRKRVMSNYMGCPSAKDFAELWDCDLEKLGDNDSRDLIGDSNSFGSVVPGVTDVEISRGFGSWMEDSNLISEANSVNSIFGVESEVGSTNLQSKIFNENQERQHNIPILQQIVDLEKVQLSEGSNHSSLLRGQMKMKVHSTEAHTWKQLGQDSDQKCQHPQGLGMDLQQEDSMQHELLQHFSLPLPQPENLNSLNAGIPLHGDTFWHCKSPVQNTQLWSQNMQDLGTCEAINCYDGFSIPDVDLTFQNYEELFGTDQDQTKAMFDHIDGASCSMEKDASLGKSDGGYPRAFKDIPVTPSVYLTRPSYEGNDFGPFDQAPHFTGSINCARQIQPTYSSLLFPLSRLSAEANGIDYIDSGISPNIIRAEPPRNSLDAENAHSEARGNAMIRYKEKKKIRMYEKRIRYASRKARADVRRRVKGRFVKAEGAYEIDTIDITTRC